MKTFLMLEIATEIAWQVGDILSDKPRAESRWFVAQLAQELINSGRIDDNSEDIDEEVSAFLDERGLK